jgi:hypothetical protein
MLSSMEIGMNIRNYNLANSDYSSIILDIKEIKVRAKDGTWIDLDVPEYEFDLLNIVNGKMVVVGSSYVLQPGVYTQVRFVLGEANRIKANGLFFDLKVPSGEQSGLKLVGEFELFENKLTCITINFDVDKSIVHTGPGNISSKKISANSKFILKPVIHFEQAENVGNNFPLMNSGDYEIIKNITFEKTEVCRGEEFRVDTTFVNPSGLPGDITVAAAGEKGNPLILVYYSSGIRMVPVSVTDFTGKTESIRIPLLVKDCENSLPAQIFEGPPDNKGGMQFFVIAPGMSGNISYAWDFGDGSVATSNTPVVSHSYANRIQVSFLESFIVKVRVSGGQEERSGRRTISMPNPHYMTKYFKAKYLLETAHDDIMSLEGGFFKADFAVFNPGNMNVEFTGIVQSLNYCDESLGSVESSITPYALLGFGGLNRFSAGSGRLSIPVSSVPGNVCSVSFAIQGRTSEGDITAWASMFFGIKINAQKAVAVDAVTREKLLKALPLLGYPKVLRKNDLIRLEMEGKI